MRVKEQGCSQFLTNTGTVITHCAAREDVSIVRDERDKLTRAIESRNELLLKASLRSAAHIACLKQIIDEGMVKLIAFISYTLKAPPPAQIMIK